MLAGSSLGHWTLLNLDHWALETILRILGPVGQTLILGT